MRPQQQNRRMRGRGNNNNNNNNNSSNNNNNNNRKGPNPLTRSYESNGPDVKIRGTAQQVAEKYMTLAGDAQSSGDRVIAENYLQHAEHYNRIIMTAQAQLAAQQQQQRESQGDSDDDNNNDQDGRQDRNDEGRSDHDRDNNSSDQNRQHANGSGPQPVIEGVPAEVAHSQQNQPRDNRHRNNGNQDHIPNGDVSKSQDTQANGPGDDAPAANAAPKRPRRPRKPRETTVVEASGENDGGNEASQPTETAS